jgi:hypothetical protein|tara:strand:- start:10810 stop:12828 length:2019 start_codon:yes stop_codon:yes gene_type:complete
MGNALQGTIAALDKGLIGGNPLESKFAAIDKGIKDVQDWKANIDKQRLDLKKTTSKSIREAEKYAAENMPSNDTAAAKMVESLAKFKEDAFISEKLVRNGNVPPEENLIFQENGKQTFEILSDFVKTFGDEIDVTEERAKGKYITNDKGEQIFVKPQSGELEAIKQQIQTQIGTLAGVDVNFDDKGMGIVDFYKMEVDERTKTLVRKLDYNGKPIYIDGQSGMSVLALKHKANTRADRIYITDQVEDFANSAVGTNYQIMAKDGLMVGNVIADSRNNPDLKANVNNQVAANTTNIEHVASLFTSENGMGGKLVSFTDYDNLTDAQKKETFTVDILDENLEEKKVTVPKYSRIAAANSNNAIVPEMTEEQIEAVKGYNRRSLVAGLQRKITKGTKQSQFDPNRNKANQTADQTNIDKGVRTIASLNNLRGAKTPEEMQLSLQELQGLSGLKYNSIKETTSIITGPDGNDKEIVTSVSFNLNGKDVEMKFGDVATENGKKVFKETSGEDFVNANYEYINAGGVSSDIALKNFLKNNTLFDNVSQTGTGTRNKKYGSTKELSLTQTYKAGEDKTTLKKQLKTVFENADTAETMGGQDMDNLVGGVKETIISAYGALGLDLPKGFKVKANGDDLMISAMDGEGVIVIQKVKDIADASDEGYQVLQGAVSEFITKLK